METKSRRKKVFIGGLIFGFIGGVIITLSVVMNYLLTAKIISI